MISPGQVLIIEGRTCLVAWSAEHPHLCLAPAGNPAYAALVKALRRPEQAA